MTTVLGIAAAAWGLVMAAAPLLQVHRMWVRRSSGDVSIRFFVVLMPGFALWVAYGLARSDWVLVVPNTVGLLVAAVAIVVANRFRRNAADARRPAPAR